MAYFKSAVYCAALGGLGYILMLVVTPDEKKMTKILARDHVEHLSAADKKRQAIVDVLRGAAEGNSPMYRQTREEIDKARDDFVGKNRPRTQ